MKMQFLERNSIIELNTKVIPTEIEEVYLRTCSLDDYLKIEKQTEKDANREQIMDQFIFNFCVDCDCKRFTDLEKIEDVQKLHYHLKRDTFNALMKAMNTSRYSAK